ncbi:MAG: hypothetical protein IRZ33_03335 [Alicyclobacillaceae bacterium]|nr:hypothetical protein [Alicyclobacillaceae bacterium]
MSSAKLRRNTFAMCAFALLVAAAPGAVAGCGSSYRQSSGVTERLPAAIAGAPQTLRVPAQRVDNLPLLKAERWGNRMRIFSRAAWHGRVIRLYYLPADNVLDKGDHYDLRAARKVQKIGEAQTRPDGTWSTWWYVGNFRIPAHRKFFILARSDADEVGLVQITPLN